jgi:hypothetical protein
MARPNFHISDEKMRRKMKEYERLCGKEVKQLVHNAGRVCCVELAKFTFPKEKSQGETRVGADIAKILMPLNTNWFQQVVKARSGKKHNAGRVSMFDGSQPLLKTLEEAKQWHKQNKLFRRGKAFPQSKKAIVSQRVRDRLVKYTQKKVGLAKAGWAAAALLCKADVRAPLRGIPRWVTRNLMSGAGKVNDSRASGFGWKIGLTNKIDYTSDILKASYEDTAMTVARGKFFKMLSHAIRYQKAKEAGLHG